MDAVPRAVRIAATAHAAAETEAAALRRHMARIVALSPSVFPSVAIEADWTAALAEARAMIDHRKGTGRWTSKIF